MKHVPFESIYREEFEVVEEREGNISRYPHTQQLPLLLRALNMEFYGALPARIARVDVRADDFHKILIKSAALMFCNAINMARTDQLRLFCLLNPDRVSKVAIVQQITEHSPRGDSHRFRFYAGEDFCPEIRLSGKRVVFADHVLQRFSSRVPNNVGEDLTYFLMMFFGSSIIALKVGPGRAFVLPYNESILAFPFQESATEYFVTTCLTVNEMNSFDVEMPPPVMDLHYAAGFVRPQIRHWLPTKIMMDYYNCWERKVQLPEARTRLCKKLNWHFTANWIKGHVQQKGFGPGSRLIFLDNIPGPRALEMKPGQEEPRINELEIYKQMHPGHDWDAIFEEVLGK